MASAKSSSNCILALVLLSTAALLVQARNEEGVQTHRNYHGVYPLGRLLIFPRLLIVLFFPLVPFSACRHALAGAGRRKSTGDDVPWADQGERDVCGADAAAAGGRGKDLWLSHSEYAQGSR